MSDPSLTGPVRPVRGSMPKFYREVCNLLIDQGWEFVPGERGHKHKLIPPDPTKPPLTVAATPSPSSRVVWISKLRRCGAILDDDVIERISRADSRRRLRQSMRDFGLAAQRVETDPSVEPISTRGASWRPPEPEPTSPRPRVLRAPSVDDAKGTAWTLGQARDMLRQGYHITKVVKRTGWGANHLRDLVDSSGYFHFDEGLSQ